MSKHTLALFTGERFEWDDDVRENTEQRRLLDLYSDIGKHHYLTTYFGEDPYKDWNDKIAQLQGQVTEWLISNLQNTSDTLPEVKLVDGKEL